MNLKHFILIAVSSVCLLHAGELKKNGEKTKMKAVFDFHLHTVWSYDATCPVEDRFRKASELGLRAIAITDHHGMDALPEVKACHKLFPEIITFPAAEFTVKTSIGSVDLVCLNLPWEIPADLKELLLKFRKLQQNNAAGYLEAFRAGKVDFTEKDLLTVIRRYRPVRVIAEQGLTMPHGGVFRQVLLEKGFFRQLSDFKAWMEPYWKFYPVFKEKRPGTAEVVALVKKYGGLVFIAHPYKYFNGCDYARMDALRQEIGFDGIECAHPSIPPEFTPKYREYCVKHHLLSTAGTDCHAAPGFDFLNLDKGQTMADHLGQEEWLDEILARIRKTGMRDER